MLDVRQTHAHKSHQETQKTHDTASLKGGKEGHAIDTWMGISLVLNKKGLLDKVFLLIICLYVSTYKQIV